MKASALIYLIIFGLLPVIFHYSYSIQKKILFLNFGKYIINIIHLAKKIINSIKISIVAII